jgi:hypothetical protein
MSPEVIIGVYKLLLENALPSCIIPAMGAKTALASSPHRFERWGGVDRERRRLGLSTAPGRLSQLVLLPGMEESFQYLFIRQFHNLPFDRSFR